MGVSEVSFVKPTTEFHEILRLQDGEIGIAEHTYYILGNAYIAGAEHLENSNNISRINYRERIAANFVGLSDMEALGIKLHKEDDTAYSNSAHVYVSESLYRSLFDEPNDDGANQLLLTVWDHGEMVEINGQSDIMEPFDPTIHFFKNTFVVGTYEDNEYFSGNDILLSMTDYNTIYRYFSVTDDEFYFDRMEVFEEMAKKHRKQTNNDPFVCILCKRGVHTNSLQI